MIRAHQKSRTWLGLTLVAVGLTLALPSHAGKKPTPAAVPTQVQTVWPSPPDKPRVKFLQQYSNNFDVEPRVKKSWVDKMVGNPDKNIVDIFEKPQGVAADSKGRVFITSAPKSMVFIVEKENQRVIRFRGNGAAMLRQPMGVTIDSQDNFYVADPVAGAVTKFSPNGDLLNGAAKDKGLKNPTFLALDESRKRLYVVDSKQHQVFAFNLDTFEPIGKIGKPGYGKGEFGFPIAVAVSPLDGTVAVTDTTSCSVELFTPEFKFIKRVGSSGTAPGQFVRPKGAAYDSEGNLWVVDAAFNNFQIFNPKGQVLMFVGSYGWLPGQFILPMGIFIDKQNRVYVADQLNNRVEIFQFLGGN